MSNLLSSSNLTATVISATNYLPKNPLQVPFQCAWDYMNNHYSRVQIACIGSILVHEVFFVILNVPLFLAQFVPFLQRYKVQQDKPETYDNQMKAFRLILFSHVFIDMPFICGTYIFTEFFNIPFSWDTMPHWSSVMGRIIISMVMEDTWHYFLHRIMHSKRFYKHCHKVHHTFQAPFSIAAEYAHPLETLILGMGTMWGVLLLGNHLVVIWGWTLVRMLESYDVHSGYEFPFNPLHLIPFYGGTRFHDFHHKNFTGNYSSTFTWWDKLFGTDSQYKEYLKKQESLDKKQM